MIQQALCKLQLGHTIEGHYHMMKVLIKLRLPSLKGQ